MTSYQHLVVDTAMFEQEDLLSAWHWLVPKNFRIFLVSEIGDVFFLNPEGQVYWLDVGLGELILVAESTEEFDELMKDENNLEDFFLPSLIKKIIEVGIQKSRGQVYGYITLPVLGGEYEVANFEPIDLSVHLDLAGQINEQVKDLPDGTEIQLKIKE